VEGTGDRNNDYVIAGITSTANTLGKALADQFAVNIIDGGFDRMPGSVVMTYYLGIRVAASYRIYRTALNKPPPPPCERSRELAVGQGILTAVAGTLGAAGASTAGGVAGAASGVLGIVTAFQC
jgi:hypothetical protein